MVLFSYSENPLDDLSKKVCHTYDLRQLLQFEIIQVFVNSTEFDSILLQVGINDYKAIPNDKNCLYQQPKEALIYSKNSIV